MAFGRSKIACMSGSKSVHQYRPGCCNSEFISCTLLQVSLICNGNSIAITASKSSEFGEEYIPTAGWDGRGPWEEMHQDPVFSRGARRPALRNTSGVGGQHSMRTPEFNLVLKPGRFLSPT